MDEIQKQQISQLKQIWQTFIEKISQIKNRQKKTIKDFAEKISQEKISSLQDKIKQIK